jgi:hypothetical protein
MGDKVVLMVASPNGDPHLVGPMSRRWAEMLFVPTLGDRLVAMVDYIETVNGSVVAE